MDGPIQEGSGKRLLRLASLFGFDGKPSMPFKLGEILSCRTVSDTLYPNRDDLFRNYPELEPDDIQQALAFAAANLEDSAA
jgi:hypothetical protein